MEGEKTYTITVYHPDGSSQVFTNCTEIEAYENKLGFIDQNNKTHEFYGVQSHIAQD